MIGIGIDTGGTCTDCVIIESETGKVLSWTKTQTTKQDLKQGIIKALKGVDSELLRQARYLSMSTTLATNACVEGKGGRAKLVFIDLKPRAIEMAKGEYGLPSISDIYFLNTEETADPWENFRHALRNELKEFDSLAVVQHNPLKDGGEKERIAEQIIREELDIPVVKGYDLFQEINVQKRGATALLNARLLPIMKDFIESIDRALSEMGLNIPVNIVKSDGSIMSEKYALMRPVETLMSGPAASIMGATRLSVVKDALICDMGGTTTDCAVIRNGVPVTSGGGITIGEWRTMVKGVNIDTFALGGDTGIGYYHGDPVLEERRAVPLSSLAASYPQTLERLRRLVDSGRLTSYPAATFFMIATGGLGTASDSNSEAAGKSSEQELINDDRLARFTENERRIVEALKNGPMIYEDLAMAAGSSPYVFRTGRLEDEGIIIRSKLTPTDIMHYRGDFTGYSREAAVLGLKYYAYVLRRTPDALADEIYEMARERLYSNLVRILVKHEMGDSAPDDSELRKLSAYMYRKASALDSALAEPSQSTGGSMAVKTGFIDMSGNAETGIIGIGAPVGIFIRNAAGVIGCEADVPEFSHVANAVGAAVGTVFTQYSVKISPRNGHYVVAGGTGKPEEVDIYGDAIKKAKKLAEEHAIKKAAAEGALTDITVDIEVIDDYYSSSGPGSEIYVGTTVIASVKKPEI